MRRFFCDASVKILRRFRRVSSLNHPYRTVAGASLVSLAATSAHLFMPLGQKNGASDKLMNFVPDIELPSEVLVRLFHKFASVEVNGEAFMTPRDFIDCVTGARPPVSVKRHVIDTRMAEQLLAKTPRLQTEVLRAEFYHFSCGNDSISPLQLAQIILRYAELPEKVKEKGLEHVAGSIMFEEDSIDFDSFRSFFNLLFQYEDLYSALRMYMLSNRAISKGALPLLFYALNPTFP
ncbi:Calcium uptake protein 3 mitochondrial [Taenia solium]